MDSTPLVGRDRELALLREQLLLARSGQARIVFVRGEAGVGKTFLTTAAARAAPDFTVVSASGEESEQDIAYGVADQLFAAMSAGRAAEAGPTPHAVGAALLRALSDAQQASDSAILLLVDDLPWADVSSQQALVFALRRLRADTVCVVLCSRVEDDACLVPGIQRLRHHPSAVTIGLTGLSESGVAQLADRAGVALPPDAVTRLHHHTGGNPLWSVALLQELDREHLADSSRPLPAPQPFEDIVRQRLSQLSSGARALVETSAVAGTDWPLSSLGDISRVRDPYPALAEAIRADLLREVGGSPVRVRPAHSLVSAAVLSGIDVGRRSGLHFRLSQAAATEHDRLHHAVSASTGPDDALAAQLEHLGHDQVMEGQWVSAASTLSTAARLSSSSDHRAELTEEAMAMALLAGDVGQATLLSHELATKPDRPRSLSLQGWLALARGRHHEAEDMLRRAVARAAEHAPAEVEAQARMILAQLLIFGGRASEAVDEARRAADLAPPATPGAAHARGLLGVALATSGELESAFAALGEVDVDDRDPSAFPVLVARGSTLVMAAEYATAASELERVATSTDRLGMFQYSCVLHGHAARALFVLGDWISAIDHGQRAVNAAEDADLTWPLSPLHSTMAQTHARMGAWALAEHHTRAALAAARQISDSMSVSYAHTAEAVLAHSRGDAAGVVAAVAPILAMRTRDGTDLPGILDWPVVHLEALITMGRHAEAADHLDAFLHHVKRVERPFPRAEAARIEGLLARAGNSPDEALAHLQRAGALAEEAGAPFEAARAELDRGRVLVEIGRSAKASVSLGRALETFARLGAQPFVREAGQLLDAMGATPSRWTSPRGAGLTPQEIAVSRLVRKGMTNREIAAELFLSTKTVEFHLRHVYMKLGITSRTQLVARSAELIDLRAGDGTADRPLGPVQDE